MVPERALGRVIGRTAADKKGYQKAVAPGSDVTRLIGPAVAPPGKLATIPAALATLLDNGTDLPGKPLSRDPV